MKFYTVKEVADLLSLGEITIRRIIRSGDLRAYKVAKGWRIEEDDLKEFIKSKSNMEG